MNRKLATLIIFLLGMAFTCSVNAIESNQTGKVDIHGFITQGYMVTNHNNFLADTEGDGTSQFNEIGINFASDVSERLRMGVQFISRDLGKMGNHEVTIDWAVADYSFYDWLYLRAGKIKIPHAMYNMERDVDMLRTPIFLPQSMYTEIWRDSINTLSGLGVYGYVPLKFMGNMSYNICGGNIAMKENGGEARLLENQVPKQIKFKVKEMNTIKSWNGYLSLDTIFGIEGLKLVGTYIVHEFDSPCTVWDGTVTPTFTTTGTSSGEYFYPTKESSFETRMKGPTASIEFARGNTVFAAEYGETKYDLKLPLPATFPQSPMIVDGALSRQFSSMGYYASLTQRFTDWLQMGVYYSEYYADKDDKKGENAFAKGLIPAGQQFSRWNKDSCLTFRFDLTPNWILKLEGHYIDGTALLLNDDNNTNSAGDIDYSRYWTLYAAKLSYSF